MNQNDAKRCMRHSIRGVVARACRAPGTLPAICGGCLPRGRIRCDIEAEARDDVVPPFVMRSASDILWEMGVCISATQYEDLMHEQHSKNTCSRELQVQERMEQSRVLL